MSPPTIANCLLPLAILPTCKVVTCLTTTSLYHCQVSERCPRVSPVPNGRLLGRISAPGMGTTAGVWLFDGILSCFRGMITLLTSRSEGSPYLIPDTAVPAPCTVESSWQEGCTEAHSALGRKATSVQAVGEERGRISVLDRRDPSSTFLSLIKRTSYLDNSQKSDIW